MKALTGRHLSPGIALNHLEELFNGQSNVHRKRGVTVFLVDEVDLLVTRNQQVKDTSSTGSLKVKVDFTRLVSCWMSCITNRSHTV